MNRIAVRYKSKVLMPMKSSRVSKFIEQKKGRICYDRKLKIHILQLFDEPKTDNVQEIVIGLDPGSCFDGFSVVSKRNHHCNFELVQRKKKGKVSIKAFLKRRAQNKRLRRSRLWHRKIRFDNRTSKKLAPTIRANVDFRKWLITKLMQVYPISKIVVEDVRFNHYVNDKGSSFSQAEQGKNELYMFIRERTELELIDGTVTHKLRTEIFGYDPKLKDKGSKRFEAHCIDSFVIAMNGMQVTEMVDIKLNRDVLFIEKCIDGKVPFRRCLTRLRPLGYGDNKFHYQLLKGGIKLVTPKTSKKRNLCRVKPKGIHSNHPKKWEYLGHGFAERTKQVIKPYGGTKIELKFIDNEFVNRKTSHSSRL